MIIQKADLVEKLSHLLEIIIDNLQWKWHCTPEASVDVFHNLYHIPIYLALMEFYRFCENDLELKSKMFQLPSFQLCSIALALNYVKLESPRKYTAFTLEVRHLFKSHDQRSSKKAMHCRYQKVYTGTETYLGIEVIPTQSVMTLSSFFLGKVSQ